MRKSNLAEEENHVVIFPKKCTVSNIIQWSHHSFAHGARKMTLNPLRQSSVWNVNVNAVVWHLIHKCVISRKFRWKIEYHKMVVLSRGRSTEPVQYTYRCMYLFGPLLIKKRRSELKHYDAFFTCFSSHVVHIETNNSLDADFVIVAPRRFMFNLSNLIGKLFKYSGCQKWITARIVRNEDPQFLLE